MNIINCTAETINIIGPGGLVTHTFPPAGRIARFVPIFTPKSTTAGVPTARVRFWTISDLPEPIEETLYIVSSSVFERSTNRTDLMSPGELVRNRDDEVIGYKNLRVP